MYPNTFVTLLLLITAVKTGVSFNIGHVTMPLFQMLVKDLPQDEVATADDYSGGDNPALLTAYYARVKVLDAWEASTLSFDLILRDRTTTVITDARTLFERGALVTANLAGYNCTRFCYNVSVPLILNVTGWSEERLDGKVQPTVRLQDIHDAMVKAIEERFCCNMTEIAISLGMDPVTGVKKTAVYLDVWEQFVPLVTQQTVQCKADELQVTTLELAELLRTDLPTLLSYDLNEMDEHFFPAYEDLLRRKNLFETKSIVTGGLFSNYLSGTMADFAASVSQFTARDLEILYQWQAPQLFAIENIPMSIFNSGCISTVSLTDSLFVLSQTLFGQSNDLPDCDVAFLLSRSFNEVATKFNISAISNRNALEIFRSSSEIRSWFNIYQLLQLNIDEGIWVETPSVSQVALFGGKALNTYTAEGSIPIAVRDIKTFNTTSTLNTIMRNNYNSFLTTLLATYGYSSAGLAQAAGITLTQLNALTIQEAHSLIIDSIQARYRINDVTALLGNAQVDMHVLINLPSFEWPSIVEKAIMSAFGQSADAFSVLLSAGGVQITTIEGSFPAIQVSDAVTYHADRFTPTELASFLRKQLSGIYALSFAEYHQLHINEIVPLLRRKILYEVQNMEDLLTSVSQDFDDVKSRTIAEVITQLTGLSVENLRYLYNLSTTFINSDLALTFQTANETRLCNDFLGRTMFDIVRIISQTANKICFLCTTDPCGANTMCRDIPDSFVCTCNAGYTGNANSGCIDIPECLLRHDDCDENAQCQETPGSFECSCNVGFTGDGRNCQDINECAINPARCGLNGICTNTEGSFICNCQTGYRWNGTSCIDIDECTENTDNCHNAAICTNTIGSFTCHCPNGLSGDGLTCVDILECSFQAGSFSCHARADCFETFGSFICQCKTGYEGDGQICTDIDECSRGTHNCHVNATCFDTEGSFVCVCNDGFTGNGTQCDDINECDENLDNCHENANCFNNIGSFYCACKDGFNGNGTYCYVAEVSFTRATAVINEGDDVEISINLNGRIDEIAFVTIQVSGSATENIDYSTFSKSVVFNVNEPLAKTFNISTTDDQRLEGLETITLTLSSVLSHVITGDIPSMTITIVDNDAIGVTFSQQTYTVNEDSNSANVIVLIQSGIVEREFIVSVSTLPGTAIAGVDFTTHSEQLTFSPGNTSPKLVQVPIANDSRVEGDETFSVLLSTTDSDVNVINSPATVSITDGDVATVKFQSSTYRVDENSGSVTVRLDVTGLRDISLTARLNTGNIGAAGGEDFISITNKDIVIPTSTTVITETIQIQDDGILEFDETFSVTVTSQSEPYLITDVPASTTVTIDDNDVVSARFSRLSYSTTEEFTQVNVRVILSGQLQRPVQLSLSTQDQTAAQPVDYLQATVTLNFNPGDTQERNVSIQILEDTLVENTESLLIQLATADQNVVFPNGNTASITINDNDVANIYIPNDSYTFNENDATTNIPVVLQGNLSIPVTARFSTTHDTATWPSDFIAITNHEIEFRPGETAQQLIPINIVDDDVVESTEQFSVSLSSADGKVTIGTHQSANVLIADNDKLRVSFSSSHYEADEDSGFALVGLVLQDTLETTVTVRLIPSNGTAIEPQDFPLITYQVVLDPGPPRTVPYRINITNDMLEEYREHFFLGLSSSDAKVEVVDPKVANISIGESDDIFFCDPNARQYPCHIKADCLDVPGSFECTCITGYSGDGLSCENIDECEVPNRCPFNATCVDNEGSYTCICTDGFRGDGTNCIDINECSENTHDCHVQARCENSLGSYDCVCNSGWSGTGQNCSDINECDQVNDCHNNATCINNPGSYDCVCKPGFRGDGKTCADIDECAERSDDCHERATCTNNVGGFTCQCNVGWYGNGTHCMDIDECKRSQDNDCDNERGLCINNDGSFTCQCKNGYRGDGKTCDDINECIENSDGCPNNSVCQNTIPGFNCICNPGFVHQGDRCADIDECANDTLNSCHTNADCNNLPGTFSCACKDGYTGNGTHCSNVNECANSPGPCDINAECADTDGSFNCTCRSGFTGTGIVCEDIIECILLPRQYPCDIRATCQDTAGSFICTCPQGFTLNVDGKNCDDIDECALTSLHNCHDNATCRNTPGSYRCECNDGFVGDGKVNCIDTTCTATNPCSADADCSVNVTTSSFKCICHSGFAGDGFTCNDINECLTPSSCGANTNCTNSPRGSYTCSCQSGFSGDPNVGCIDIDECVNDPCHVNATCHNQPATYDCTCKTGFTGDGNTCNDIDECRVAGTCDDNATCTNTIGSHYCTCNNGYSGNGKICEDIDECRDPSRCPTNSNCNNLPGSFSCTCKLGFMEVNDTCEDIDECQNNPCTEDGAVCTNTPGSYTCTCPEEIYNNGNKCFVFCPFKLDLAFIVDTSDSVTTDDFQIVKQFMTDTISRMEIGPMGNHIAAVSFGDTAEIFLRFNEITGTALTRRNLVNRFTNFTRTGGLTRIDLALHLAQTVIFTASNGMRTDADVRKVAVVITDGKQTMGPGVPREPLAHTARRLQSNDITVLTVAIGQKVPRSQLLNITNNIEENILQVNSFSNLLSVVNQLVNISCSGIDECDLYDDVCHKNAVCKDTLGAFSCLCNQGYTGDGFDCTDVNECEGVNACNESANCSNTDGSYECTCKSGYSGDGKQCTDVDECADNTHDCHANAVCTNTLGAFTCACESGYEGDGKNSCVDIDECTTNTSNCHEEATCGNTIGSFTCTCNQGYSGSGVVCLDENECTDGSHDCHGNASCANTVGSFRCTCLSGFTGDGKNSCVDADECSLNTDSCVSEAMCENTFGSYICKCPTGYTGDGKSGCDDLNECQLDIDNCDSNATCNNTLGSFSCECKKGYSGNGTICVDENECTDGSHDCHGNASCANTVGSFRCTCLSGFTGDGKNSCVDINECNTGSHNCDANADCTDTQGSFTCRCKSGYSGDGVTCNNVTQCNPGSDDCDTNADCVDNQGRLTCRCKSGYSGDGVTCNNINECNIGSRNCDANADCIDTSGSFTCLCKSGYSGNGVICNDTDECAPSGSNSCNNDQTCWNYPGTHECFCTSPGQFLVGDVCQDVSIVTLTMTILNRTFELEYANANSAAFYKFKKDLEAQLDLLFKGIYRADYIGSAVLNLSNGSVIATSLLIFKPNKAPAQANLLQQFRNNLRGPDPDKKSFGNTSDEYEISVLSSEITDYNECDPTFQPHRKDCPENSFCEDLYGSYSCTCLSGFEKHSEENICVGDDKHWWMVYLIVFATIAFIVLLVIFLFCVLEFQQNKELYSLHDENRPHDRRIDEEVAPGFPGSVPRTTSNGSQLLLGSVKGLDSEKMAMYEVNPIYDSTNG